MATKIRTSKLVDSRAPEPTTRGTKSEGSSAVTVRMYRHGLGDCFLLQFPRATGSDATHVLIDCGLIGVAKDPKPLM
jgi:hypothetical protein